MISGDPYIEASALHYDEKELESKKHPHELLKSEDIVVKINYKQMGVGGDVVGGLDQNRNIQFTLIEIIFTKWC